MAAMMLISPQEVVFGLAKRAQKKRLSLNFSQKTLAERSGVSLASLKVFERSGKISLESLLKIALVLDSLEEFTALFKDVSEAAPRSLDELLNNTQRRRGRK